MDDKKSFTLRIPKDVWNFLKKKAIDKDMSLNELILSRLNKYKEKSKKPIDLI